MTERNVVWGQPIPGTDLVIRACRTYGLDSEESQLILRHHGWCLARQLRYHQVVSEADLDQGLLLKVWMGNPQPGDLESYCRKVKPLLATATRDGSPTLAETANSKLIWRTLEIARRRSERGEGGTYLIQGDAGCGKTFCSAAWCAAVNHGSTTFYEPLGAGGLKGMIYDIAELKGVDTAANYQRVYSRLVKCFVAGCVLVVDEAHLLVKHSAGRFTDQGRVDFLRRLADVTRAAVVFLSTDQKFERFLASTGYLDKQLWRRAGRLVDLPPRATDTDIGKLFAYRCPKIECDDKLLDVLRAVQDHEKGGFGQIAKVILDAEDLALESERQVTRKDLLLCAAMKLEAMDALQKRVGSQRVR